MQSIHPLAGASALQPSDGLPAVDPLFAGERSEGALQRGLVLVKPGALQWKLEFDGVAFGEGIFHLGRPPRCRITAQVDLGEGVNLQLTRSAPSGLTRSKTIGSGTLSRFCIASA
jgi:hypothetical protein